MAMVYDNLKGSFKEGKATDESKNQSGLMAKELSALSSAGPEGHTLAYITPEEEKLLQKATGKETITTAYGIPTYETEMTVEEMEAKLTRDKLNELLNQAVSTATADTESRKNITGDTPQEIDKKLTEATENQINTLYSELLKNEYDRVSKIQSDRMFYGLGDKIKSGVDKVKDSSKKIKDLFKYENESGTKSLLMDFIRSEGMFAPSGKKFDTSDSFGLMTNTNKKEPQKNVTLEKDYHLNKFLMEQNELMKSKEDYYPPLP